jgi:hypothetical protein
MDSAPIASFSAVLVWARPRNRIRGVDHHQQFRPHFTPEKRAFQGQPSRTMLILLSFSRKRIISNGKLIVVDLQVIDVPRVHHVGSLQVRILSLLSVVRTEYDTLRLSALSHPFVDNSS